MDFHTLPRRDLQALCKRNKIAANMTNVAMADALQALPTVEGLEAIIKEAQSYQSPKKAVETALPEPASRSCRRTSTRRQTNPPGSSLQRTRRAAPGRAGKNEAAVEKEDGAEEDNAQLVTAVGIPNSPITLSARGRSTRTLITTGGLGAEEEGVEAEKKGEQRKVEPLPLEISNTPATRTTRGRRPATQITKPSAEGGEAAAKKQEEAGAPAVPQTPAASTARRASTRRVTRAAPAPEEASGARSTRYRTRRAGMDEAAETETAAGISTTIASRRNGGMRRAKAEDAGSPAVDVPVAKEDGAEGGASAAQVEVVVVVEPLAPVALADDAAAKTEPGSSADPTAEICAALPEVDGSDGFRVDQTVEKAKSPDAGVVVEEKGSDGVDQTVGEEESGETVLVDPTVDDEIAPTQDPIDRTVENCEIPVDQTVMVEKAAAVDSDPTVVGFSHLVMAVPAAVHQTVENSPSVHLSDLQGVVVDAPFDQTAAEEEAPEIVEISLDPTVDDEGIPVVGLNDQTVQEVPDLANIPSEEMLVPVGVEGHVDPTSQEIEVPLIDSDLWTIDPTVENGEITTSEGEAEEPFEEVTMFAVVASPVIEDTEAGIQATSQVGAAAAPATATTETVLPANVETPAMDVQQLLRQTMEDDDRSGRVEKKITPVKGREEGEEEAEKEEKAPGLVSIDEIFAEWGEEEEAGMVSIDEILAKWGEEEEATGLFSIEEILAEEGEEEEARKEEEEATGPVFMDGPPAETEKAVDLVQEEGEEEEAEKKEEEVRGLVSMDGPPAETEKAVDLVQEEGEEEEAEKKEEEATGLVSMDGPPDETEKAVALVQDEGEEEEAEKKEEEATGLVSMDGSPDETEKAVALVQEEGEEEEAEKKEEEATDLVSMDGSPDETEKAVDLVQAQQPSMAVPVNDLSFLFGNRDKENAAVTACLSPLSGGGGLREEKQQREVAVVEYDTTISMRKLKAALKEQLQAEERKKKRAALAALDDNCIMSPKQC